MTTNKTHTMLIVNDVDGAGTWHVAIIVQDRPGGITLTDGTLGLGWVYNAPGKAAVLAKIAERLSDRHEVDAIEFHPYKGH